MPNIPLNPYSIPDPSGDSSVLTKEKLNTVLARLRADRAEHWHKIRAGIRKLIPLVHPITGQLVGYVWHDEQAKDPKDTYI